METITSLNVFIASPGDTVTEQAAIGNLISKWNRQYAEDRHVTLNAKHWKRDIPSTSQVKGQDFINEHVLSKCDILIGIFWGRFGDPTEQSESGTEEEIELFLKKNKKVILYFLTKDLNFDQIDTTAIDKIKSFRSRYKSQGIYKEIKNTSDLEDEVIIDLNYNVKKVLESSTPVVEEGQVGSISSYSDDYKKQPQENENPWYKNSISNLITEYMEEKNYSSYKFRRELTLRENLILWKESPAGTYNQLLKVAEQALCYAFDKKYGNYNYAYDLRYKYKDSWYEHIKDFIDDKKKNSDSELRVIGVGANYGLELVEIFGNTDSTKLEVLDVSPQAMARGKRRWKDIKFHEGRMEENQLLSSHYDIYLNLRSVHLRGADMSMAIGESYRCLKKNGLAIISVSNGYLDPDAKPNGKIREIRGLYDNLTGRFEETATYDLAHQIQRKMRAYGYQDVEWKSGPTEVFVFGVKGE